MGTRKGASTTFFFVCCWEFLGRPENSGSCRQQAKHRRPAGIKCGGVERPASQRGVRQQRGGGVGQSQSQDRLTSSSVVVPCWTKAQGARLGAARGRWHALEGRQGGRRAWPPPPAASPSPWPGLAVARGHCQSQSRSPPGGPWPLGRKPSRLPRRVAAAQPVGIVKPREAGGRGGRAAAARVAAEEAGSCGTSRALQTCEFKKLGLHGERGAPQLMVSKARPVRGWRCARCSDDARVQFQHARELGGLSSSTQRLDGGRATATRQTSRIAHTSRHHT